MNVHRSAAVSVIASITGWLESFNLWLSLLASIIAIIAGSVSIYQWWRDREAKKKHTHR